MKRSDSNTLGLVLALLALAGAGCNKAKSPSDTGGGEPELILTNTSSVAGPSAEQKAEVTISGVTHDEERSLIDMLHVTGLLTRGTQQVAIINGNVVSMGEDMHLAEAGHSYNLKVLSIKGTVIKLRAEMSDLPAP